MVYGDDCGFAGQIWNGFIKGSSWKKGCDSLPSLCVPNILSVMGDSASVMGEMYAWIDPEITTNNGHNLNNIRSEFRQNCLPNFAINFDF